MLNKAATGMRCKRQLKEQYRIGRHHETGRIQLQRYRADSERAAAGLLGHDPEKVVGALESLSSLESGSCR
jgi:hypothetical protein